MGSFVAAFPSLLSRTELPGQTETGRWLPVLSYPNEFIVCCCCS